MKRAFQLAGRYVLYHRFKSLLMVLCIVLTLLMPIALSILLSSFNRQIVARARSTPLIVGARGSRVDLTMHGLYFQSQAPGTLKYGERRTTGDLGLAIPLHIRVTAQKVPVVGTSLTYFEFRGIGLATGAGLVRLGDCVLGSRVAEKLGLQPGDKLITDPENVFAFAGPEPLRMRVGGILAETRTPDDDVIFVDIKTSWVIEGLIHGHMDAGELDAADRLENEQQDDTITAAPSVRPFLEITDENIGSFHFHGSTDEFPITALIVVPNDEKSAALLLGRYQREDAAGQMSEPLVVVEELMGLVFRVRRFFNANALLVAVSTALLLCLVVLLSIRLRQGEMETMFKIGCGRGTMASLIAAELLIVFLVAGLCITAAVVAVQLNADELVRTLLSRS
jgi:putative ABC transport system permease protein